MTSQNLILTHWPKSLPKNNWLRWLPNKRKFYPFLTNCAHGIKNWFSIIKPFFFFLVSNEFVLVFNYMSTLYWNSKKWYSMHKALTFAGPRSGHDRQPYSNCFLSGWFLDSNLRPVAFGGRHLPSHQGPTFKMLNSLYCIKE